MGKREGDPGYPAGWCIHYTAPPRGLQIDAPHICDAGIDLVRFAGTRFDTRPCFLDKKTGKSKPNVQPCECLRIPTPEEIKSHEEWPDRRMNLRCAVMVGIAPWRAKHKGRSFTEVVECPACKGRLHLSIAAYNGHVHGTCQTAGCVSWME